MLKPLTGLRATFKFQNFLHKKINENISTQLELTKRRVKFNVKRPWAFVKTAKYQECRPPS